MPKRKRGSTARRGKEKVMGRSVLGSDDESLYHDLGNPDPKARSYIYDEVDEYHEAQGKILLEGKGKKQHLSDDESSVEEILPLLSGDESSDGDDVYTQMAKKDEIASDLEEDADDGLPDVKAWGKKKSAYYNTDYVDQDYGGFQGSDEELAENEEKEAVAIQKRMLEQLEEADFGFQWLQQPQKPLDVEKSKDHSKISIDLSRLSQQEKLEILKMDSPELLGLIHDFTFYMKELNERLKPLLVLIKEGKLSSKSPGSSYILSKCQLIMMYCTNISFYMVLKCRRTAVRSHPIMKKLAMFKELLKQCESEVDIKLADEISGILEKMKSDGDAVLKPRKKMPPKKQKHRFRILEKQAAEGIQNAVHEKKKKKREQIETDAEKEAFQLYKMMKERQKQPVDEADDEMDDKSEEDDEEREKILEEGDENETNEKREINYQIAKNKGLTPHRKKEYRNPRVRQRMKYRRANIRRKGQVRTPKTEKTRYGGENSGIRSGVVRSVKLR